MNIHITTLIENTLGEHKGLQCEHGISFYIKVDDYSILFDTGQSDKFIENAQKLGVEIDKVDALVISHAHYDHAGGVKSYLNAYNHTPKMFFSNKFFCPKYAKKDGTFEYLGPDFTKKDLENGSYELVDKQSYRIAPFVELMADFEKKSSINRFYLKEESDYVIDDFEDEMVLCIETSKGYIVVLGCAHPGLISILNTITKRTNKPIRGIIGGTHLVEVTSDQIDEVIEQLDSFNLEFIGVSHCTGKLAEEKLKLHFKERFFANHTGTTIEMQE